MVGKRIKNRKLVNDDSLRWVASASLSQVGCRQVQALIAKADEARNLAIVHVLQHECGFECLYVSPHGNHVLQRLIECTSPAALEPILKGLELNFSHMCCHVCPDPIRWLDAFAVPRKKSCNFVVCVCAVRVPSGGAHHRARKRTLRCQVF